MLSSSSGLYRFLSPRKLIRVSSSLFVRRELSQRPLRVLLSASEISSAPSIDLKKSGRVCSSSSSLQIAFCARKLSQMSSKASQPAKSVYDFTVKDARGEDVDLSIYKGKVLLIVNVASQCGLTNSNYTELSELYPKYKDKGLEILAFPCNQFGGQEPGTNEEIVEFACTRFKAEYPIFDKVDVNGEKSAPLYKFLKSVKGGLLGNGIKWNFTKFLVDREGNVVDRYAPTTSPLSIEETSCCFLPEPFGRLLHFAILPDTEIDPDGSAIVSVTVGGDDIEGEISGIESSGQFFRGLPLLFFIGSPFPKITAQGLPILIALGEGIIGERKLGLGVHIARHNSNGERNLSCVSMAR